jgi:hypothetical protein
MSGRTRKVVGGTTRSTSTFTKAKGLPPKGGVGKKTPRKSKSNPERNQAIARVNRCLVDGSKMYYKISDIANATTNKSAGMESKFLIDTLNAIRGQCFTIHQQCKGMYPVVNGKDEGKQWLTSIDQDNDISLQHTLDKSDIPILYNTPRFCDPGMTKSKNWSLKNYIQTRLFMYNNVFKKGKKISTRNSNSSCFNGIVFDFRPFEFTMEYNKKKIYITQWMEIKADSEYGYKPMTAISDKSLNKTQDSKGFFKQLVLNYSNSKLKNSPTAYNNTHPLRLTNNANDLDNFLKFINDYDGIGFTGIVGANRNLPNVKINGVPNIKIEDDILRMFYFDLLHDLAKPSPTFNKTSFALFSLNFTNELRDLKGIHQIEKWAGAGTTGKSYTKYGSTIIKKTRNGAPINGVVEYPAMFKTIGDLSQYIYAAKYDTTVASGDRMGIAVGLYVCAKMGSSVKCMIEDGINGFILYTGRDNIKFTSKSSCKGSPTGGACMKNANRSINGKTIEYRVKQLNSTTANQMQLIENQKPKLPTGMKSLTKLWNSSSNVLNTINIDTIIKIIEDFRGYWGKTDLMRFRGIINTLKNRTNVNNSRKIKLSELNGKLNAYLNLT